MAVFKRPFIVAAVIIIGSLTQVNLIMNKNVTAVPTLENFSGV